MAKARFLLSVLTLFLGYQAAMAQKPTIVSVDKEKGTMREIVTLKGSDFGTDPTKLRVFFGGVAAQIKVTTNQLLEVYTPAGATFDNISVTNITTGLTGYTSSEYYVNFNGQDPLTVSSFSDEFHFGGTPGLYDLCLCDFNNDNKPDIGTASDNSSSLAIFKNNSTVGSIAMQATPAGHNLIQAKSLHVTCGDLNGDGLKDMVVSEGADGDRVFIFRNTGSFTFNIQSLKITGRKVKRLAIADLDLNGKPELVVTDKGSNIITILPNQSTLSNITFGSPVNILATGAGSTDALEIKDINNNGLPDIISSQFLTDVSNIYIFDNKSTPGGFNFNDLTTLNISNTLVNIRVGDLDGDQKPDIAATRLLGSDIVIFRNQSTSTQISFATALPFLTNVRPWGLDFGDLDGDGKPDIAVSAIGSKSISILNNQSTPGSISFKPLLTIPTDFIGRHVKIGDVDGDGKPDISYTSIDDNNNAIPASKITVIRNKSCFVPTISPEGPLSICTGFALQLTSREGGGVTYDWKNGGVTTTSGPDEFLDITVSGTYTVTAISESGTCSKTSNTVNITVAAPGAGITGADPNARSNSPVCTDDILNLQVDDVGATEYRWRGPNGFTATGRTPSVNDFTLDKAGLYIVDMVAGTCIAKTDSTIVQGISNPDFTVAFSGAALICLGSTKTLSVSPVVTSGFTYKWFEQTLGELPGQTNATLPTTASGNYYAQIISNHPGCLPVETPKVSLASVTAPDAAFTPSATTGCIDQVITFANQSTVDPQATPSYSWTFGDTKTSTEISPEKVYETAATFQVKLSVAYQGGECLNEETKSVTIIASPTLSITAPNNSFKLCAGDTLRLGVTGDTFTSFDWSTGASTSTILIEEAALYSVTVTTPAGCIIEVEKSIEGIDAPPVTASADDTLLEVGGSTQLSATGGLSTYLWRPGLSLNDSTSANPIATPLQDITYTVSGKDVNGCYGEASVEIKVTGASPLDLIKPDLYFSPNNDNSHEFWTIGSIESFPDCEVVVYNDKGSKVYEAKPYTNDWDGTFKGSKLPGGVYYYVIRCGGEGKAKTGSITLLK